MKIHKSTHTKDIALYRQSHMTMFRVGKIYLISNDIIGCTTEIVLTDVRPENVVFLVKIMFPFDDKFTCTWHWNLGKKKNLKGKCEWRDQKYNIFLVEFRVCEFRHYFRLRLKSALQTFRIAQKLHPFAWLRHKWFIWCHYKIQLQ